jgi:hypothetical protein
LVVHVLKESINASREGHYSSIDRHVVLSFVEVVSDYLNGEVRSRVEAILGKEHSTYSLRLLKMAKLKRNILLQPVQITVDCCVVPSS